MWLKSLEIENFKSFLEPTRFNFEPGFNLLLGANNSGKSSVFQAMGPVAGSHLSVANSPEFEHMPVGGARSLIQLETDMEEYRRACRKSNSMLWMMPGSDHYEIYGMPDVEGSLNSDWLSKKIVLGGEYLNGNISKSIFEELVYCRDDYSKKVTWIEENQHGNPKIKRVVGLDPGEFLEKFSAVFQNVLRGIYRFNSTRKPLDNCQPSYNPDLLPDASNLGACINWMGSKDTSGHRDLCELLQRVVPSVAWVQAPPIPGGSAVRLECLPNDPSLRRYDLARPLDQVGSGVANILAILYIVLTSRRPQVICIDEPNQFLHPKALRELLVILSTVGKQHQYILSAHSADVISGVKASTISMLTLKDGVTRVQQTSGKNLHTLRAGLAELGIRATDLHSHDRVLWVEGQTEELVFPKLINHFCPELSAGTAVLRVNSTGDFEMKAFDPIKVAGIYKRLTESSALVPPTSAIILDREKRKPEDITRLERETSAKLRFLPERMLECYLLHPGAIEAVLKANDIDVSSVQIEELLNQLVEAENSDRKQVDAARILSRLFAELSDARLEYKKTEHGPDLTEWLLEHEPSHLEDLGHWLKRVIEA